MSVSENSQIGKRLSKYGVAAVSAVATGLGANAAQASLVTLPVNINSQNSIETFIDILPFAPGANSIAVNFTNSSVSAANPLAPNSELMLRGYLGGAQVRGNNGAQVAAFVSSGYLYVRGVAAPFVQPAFNAGTFMVGSTYNASLTYTAFGNGDFPPGSTHVAYFTFNNPASGLTNGWLTIQMNGTASNLNPTITAIHVDTGVPEPTSMALLCLGAAGLLARRRRNRESTN